MRKLSLFKGKLFGLSMMAALLVGGTNAAWADELTVYDGTTTNYFLPNIYYFDQYTRNQYVIPASDLSVMSGGTVSSIKLYTNSSNVPYTTDVTTDVYLKEVDYTSINAYETKNDDDIVYQGTLSIVSSESGGELTITFNTPYEYGGGNLLIGIENTTKKGYKQIYFYGQTVSGASISGNSSSSLANVNKTQRNFIPKTTFTYTLSNDPAVTPIEFAANIVTYKSATFSWTNGGTETKWQIRYKADGDVDYTNTGDITEKPYTLAGLAANTKYSASIRSKMRASDYSDWSSDIEFTTPATPVIAVPTGLSAKDITSTSANLTWTSSESAWQIKYKAESDADYCAPKDVTTNPYALTGLTANTKYYVSILAVSDELTSSWSADAEFTTTAVGPEPGGSSTVTEDFESGWTVNSNSPYNITALKDGWGYVSNFSQYRIHSNGGRSGKGLYTAASPGQYIVTPAVKSGSTISFWAKKYDSGSNSFRFVKATKDGDSYTAITTTQYAYNNSLTSDWVQYSCTIPESGYVAIMLSNVAIDDIEYTVAAPTVSVVTGTNGYATFESASPLDLTTANLPQGLVAYSATVNGNKAQFTKLNQTVPAHTGILLEGAPYTEYQIATVTTGDAVTSNDFFTVDGNTTYASDNTTFYFALKKDSDPMEFQKISTAGVKLPAGKAYLEASASAFSSGARLNISFDDDAATGIENVNNKAITNSRYYDLQGRQVENPTKGLYIVNGKKVIIK